MRCCRPRSRRRRPRASSLPVSYLHTRSHSAWRPLRTTPRSTHSAWSTLSGRVSSVPSSTSRRCPPSRRTAMRVLVVGAGMLGAAVSSALSVRGHEVTVLDAGRPAGGTSSTTFAWVNANNKRPMHYQQLNADAMREHVRLGGVPRGWLVPTGHLEFATNDAHRQRLTHRVETLRDSGYRAEFVTPARAAELEPDVQVGGDPLVAWFPDE